MRAVFHLLRLLFPINIRRELACHPAERRHPETTLSQHARRWAEKVHANQPVRLAYLDGGNDRGILESDTALFRSLRLVLHQAAAANISLPPDPTASRTGWYDG